MAVTITAVSSLPTATLTVAGLTVAQGSTVDVTRSWQGQSAPVRGAHVVPVTGDTMVFVDYEVPFGVTVAYAVTARDSTGATTGQASSAAVTVDSDSVWISDPLAPGIATPVVLHGDALGQVSFARDGSVSSVVGGVVPVAVVGQRQSASGVDLSISCKTLADRDMALAVLMTADPVCVRVPGASPYSVIPSLAYVTAGTVSTVQVNSQFGGQISRIDWSDCAVVRAPATPILVPTRTIADVAAQASTIGDLALMYSTILDLARG